MGWDELESLNIHENDLTNKFAELAYKAFSTKESQDFLAFLKKEFLETEVMNPNTSASFGYFREGQNSLIRNIIKSIENYKNYMKSNKANKANQSNKLNKSTK